MTKSIKTRKNANPSYKVDDATFAEAVKNSYSILSVFTTLGLNDRGAARRIFHRRVKRLELDTSHFTGRGHLKGKTHNWSVGTTPEKALVPNSPYYGGGNALKKKLFKEGLLINQCYECGMDPIWNNKPIVLQIDHINGIHDDNRIENLRILCPNCHSQTDTYAGKNIRHSATGGTRTPTPVKEEVFETSVSTDSTTVAHSSEQSTIEDQFWANVEKTDTCWNWIGKVSKQGRPYFRGLSVKRASLELSGEVLDDDQVLGTTTCHNMLCLNPDHIVVDKTTASHFMDKVKKLSPEEGECWEWLGAKDDAGHGMISRATPTGRKTIRTHRFSWELANNAEIPKGMAIFHQCSNNWCVNPEHLSVISLAQSYQLLHNKNRKLTESVVQAIRLDFANGITRTELAKKYAMDAHTIRKALKVG